MIETIRELLHRDPFKPFRVVMTSGESYEVTDPDLVAIGHSHVFYCFPGSDKMAWLRLNQIAHVETRESAA
jgi:hypothetical protein